MNKIISIEQAVDKIQDGMTVMIGGFLAVGTPELLIDALVKKGVKNLTIIANDTGYPDRGIGKLIVNKQAKKTIASHVGTNPETGRQMNEGEMEVILVPQGTLAEQIRCGGAGLGSQACMGQVCTSACKCTGQRFQSSPRRRLRSRG